MARVTVEDCLEQIPNRFSLVLITATRAKQLMHHDPALVENEDGNKEIVTALREIAARKISVDDTALVEHPEWLPEATRAAQADGAPFADASESDFDQLPPEM